MPDGDMVPERRTVSTAELTQIVRAFADSDLRELRLVVGDVDLLVSRNEQVDGLPLASSAAPAGAPRPAVAPPPAAPAPPAQSRAAAPAAALDAGNGAPTVDRTGLIPIHSPAVGLFYRRPAPDKPPYVEVGSAVAVGDPVGTIEVMKMFTTVTSEVAGTVAEVCVEDATLVEYQQVIMYLSPPAGV